MEIKKLNLEEEKNAMPLVWKVYCECEAKECSENGRREFYKTIDDE